MKIKLTPTSIDRIKATGRRYELGFHGSASKGLKLRIGANGSKTWNYWQRVPMSKQVFRASMGEVRVLSNGKTDPVNIEEALMWASEQRQATLQGVNRAEVRRRAKSDPIMSELWTRYLTEHAKLKKKASSVREDISLWEKHLEPEFGHLKVKEVSKMQVSDFFNHKLIELRQKGGNGGRANNILALVSKMMNEAIVYGYRDTNPCSKIKKVKTNKEWPEITDHQRAMIRELAVLEGDDIALIVDLALKTGARKGEILNARWEEFHGDQWTISGGRVKNSTEHYVKLPPLLLAKLNKWRQREGVVHSDGTKTTIVRSHGWVFPSTSLKYKGKTVRGKTRRKGVTPEVDRPALADVRSAWERVRDLAGLPYLRFHDLRHDFGTQSAKGGIDPFALMQAMNHKDIKTTMLYIRRAALDGRAKVTADREAMIEATL